MFSGGSIILNNSILVFLKIDLIILCRKDKEKCDQFKFFYSFFYNLPVQFIYSELIIKKINFLIFYLIIMIIIQAGALATNTLSNTVDLITNIFNHKVEAIEAGVEDGVEAVEILVNQDHQ